MTAVALGLALVCVQATHAAAQPAYADTPIVDTGVSLIPPRDAECPPIVLPFGVAARYATSRRDGLHDGIDFKLPEGTAVLAIAAGKVVRIGAGARSAGHYVWLQHAPADTGLPFWVHSTYRHFDPAAELEAGGTVKMGQVLGHAGKPAYPNLHIATLVGGGESYEARGIDLVVAGARLVDPAVIYVNGLGGITDLERLQRLRPAVLIPYASDDGTIRPSRARMIWPVACKRR